MLRRLPPWMWLVLSLVLGTMATFMATNWLKGQSQKQVKAPQDLLTSVVVAAKEIGSAVALGGDQLVVRHWPKESVPVGSFATVEDVMGRVTSYPFGPGEPILEVKLAPKGLPPGLTALVPTDKRAMTVRVDEASGVAGFLSPDNRVDVVVALDKGSYKEDPVAKIVLQNIRVMGTGQKIEKTLGDKPQVVPTVTLEVSPEEGEKLALASQEGSIRLILRSQKDQQIVPTSGSNTASLLTGMSKGGEVSRTSVEIIRRMRRDPYNF